MRIGILGHGFVEWGGGIDFLRIIISSLHLSGEAVELHLLVPTRSPGSPAKQALRYLHRGAKALVGFSTIVSTRPASHHITDLANSAEPPVEVHAIDVGLPAIASAASKLSLDVLLPAIAPLPRAFPVPWVGYIYDFQHRYFPQLFLKGECEQRDRQFESTLASARAVVVNSRAVAADILRFYPDSGARVFDLPFSPAPEASWLAPGASPAKRYGIGRPYFMICNQFWKHKDHATAFAAFARVSAANPEVDLVCTGATDDYRDKAHFLTLQQLLAQSEIADRVHILGLIPKADQIALLKGAIALVQPTLFEGGPGGGAVFDAVALGLRCLVSGIEVNREIVEEGVTFFPAGDASALAALMTRTLCDHTEFVCDPQLLLARGRARRALAGARLIAAVEHVRA